MGNGMADLLLRGWNGKRGDGCEDRTLWEEGFLLIVYHRVQSLRFAFLHLPVPAGSAHDDRLPMMTAWPMMTTWPMMTARVITTILREDLGARF